jgi:hypothetical protein
MPEGDEGVRHFLTYWFSGLMNGLESVDEAAREAILRECGKACAKSYTADAFRDAWEQSADMEDFFAILAAKFPGAIYQPLASGSIQVRCSRCTCDLVTGGLVQSSLICGCSAYNLQENFERAWGIPVRVTLESSILEGGAQCEFLVSPEPAGAGAFARRTQPFQSRDGGR